LVTKRPYSRGSGLVVHSTEALIADLGEAQLIDSQPHKRTYYGNQDFWAPEIRERHTYSQASDVYALGVLFSQMVSLHWSVVGKKHPDLPGRQMPLRLLGIILACLSKNTSQRPTAGDVFSSLEELETVVKKAWGTCEKLELNEVEIQGILQVGLSQEMPTDEASNTSEGDITD
jgi:serine/threonine protein kinase